jgi:uncharacterized membrane protein HdeD (DUF308 family)
MSDGRRWERHAWWVFFIFGVLVVIAAPINLAGNPPNPPSPQATTGMSLSEMKEKMPGLNIYLDSVARQLGNFMLAMGVLLAAIAAFPYRKGEKWAWFAAWTVPALLAIQLVNGLRSGGLGWQADAAFIPVALAGLFLPFRRFFRRSG